MPVSLEAMLRVCARGGAVAVVAMFALFLLTGVGQDPLQYVHPSEEYGRLLLRSPAVLRAAIGLDDAFIVFYTAAFVALAGLLWERSGRLLVGTTLGLLVLLALLDMAENFHFLAMISRAEQGLLPSDGEIELQVWESLLKFHVGYLGLFLLGFTLPQETPRQRWFSRLNWYVQLPVGVLIHVTPHAVALPLVFVRFGYFLAGLLLASSLFSAPSGGASGSGARA